MKRNAKTRQGTPAHLTLTIYVQWREWGQANCGTPTAWVDKRYPGLAIHDAYELPVRAIRGVTHIASGMVVANFAD